MAVFIVFAGVGGVFVKYKVIANHFIQNATRV